MNCAMCPSRPIADAVFRQLRHVLLALSAVLTVAFPATTAHAQCIGQITSGSVSRCTGSNVALTAVFPVPGGTITWRRNGVTLTNGVNANGTTISGATSATLTLTSIDPADAGDYTVRYVVGAPFNCTGVSPAVTLTVNLPVTITAQPPSRNVCDATNVTFTTAASGFTPITYQWKKGGVNVTNGVNAAGTTVAGATTPTLSLTSVAREDAGAYTCEITNPCGTQTTNTAALTVRDVQITSPLANLTTCQNETATYSITATGSPGFTYQWQRNSVNLVDGVNTNGTTIAGATGPTLTLTSVDRADAGSFRCIVSNGCVSATSNSSILTVNTPATVTTIPTLTTCEDGTVNLSVTLGGTPLPHLIRWRRNGVYLVDGVNANGTTISGAFTTQLQMSNTSAADSGTYSCVVTNTCTTGVGAGSVITIRPATTFTTQPLAASVCPGLNASFSIAVSGTGPFTYQWLRNGSPVVNGVNASGTTVAGVGTPTLSLTSVAAGDAGAYSCRVVGACSTVTSNTADLVVGQPIVITTQPVFTRQCAGSTVSLSVAATGTPSLSYRWQFNTADLGDGTTPWGTVITGAATPTLVLSSVDFGDVGLYRCIISTGCDTAISSAATLDVTTGTAIVTQPQPVVGVVGSTATFTVAASGPTPNFYLWQHKGNAVTNGVNAFGTVISGATTPSLTLTGISASDAGDYICTVGTSCGNFRTAPAALVSFADLGTASDNSLTHTSPLVSRGIVWVRFTTTHDAVNPDRYLDINTVGSLLSSANVQDTMLALYSSAGNRIRSNDDMIFVGYSLLSFGQASPGRTYPPIIGDGAGQDGLLPAGTYYLAAGAWAMGFDPSNFAINPTSTRTGTIAINIHAGTATPACLADLNADGTIDGSDFIDFINSFGIGDAAVDPLADIVDAGGTPPGDGTIDGSDFIAFINAFAAGC